MKRFMSWPPIFEKEHANKWNCWIPIKREGFQIGDLQLTLITNALLAVA